MKIKMLVMDVDGTLTDGKINISPNGEIMKSFNVKDGYGILQMISEGVRPVIITGRTSQIVQTRAKELKIEDLYQGISDKLSKLKAITEQYGITLEEVAYIGDDVNDLDCIKACGFTACPNDALDEVKEYVSYVCWKDGGNGAVREFIQQIQKRNKEF